ncbi:AAA family ATPase [Archangium violaceum]|uniref:AAA domain-containing protein n=1 Tax=Archangium violaceum TaxID=83451 RepID=UPI00193C61C0|nr:AAA domain-containing protein [Archangium violaceum]QRK10652.1 AAA family ATPase [Archangium violaceum]
MALNTPDIALIQGPPGTGKTSVIAALMERLAQTANELEAISGSVLLTSIQYDAVENAAARTVVFGLPAVKQGRKRGRADGLDNVEAWRKERIDALESSLVQGPGSATLERIRLLVTEHLAQPETLEQTASVLRDVADLRRELLPGPLLDRLRLRATQLARGTTSPEGGEASPARR